MSEPTTASRPQGRGSKAAAMTGLRVGAKGPAAMLLTGVMLLAAGAGPVEVERIQTELLQIFAQYNPGKVANVPRLMAKYAGAELEYLAAVRQKYGVAAEFTDDAESAGATPTDCQLRRVDARVLSQEQFRVTIQGQEPVLLTHATEGWGATTTWSTAEQISAAHGDTTVSLQDPGLLRLKGSFAPIVATRPLRDHLSNLATETEPIFRNRWLPLADLLLAEANLTSHTVGGSMRLHIIFSLGGARTGVGFHSHTENWL